MYVVKNVTTMSTKNIRSMKVSNTTMPNFEYLKATIKGTTTDVYKMHIRINESQMIFDVLEWWISHFGTCGFVKPYTGINELLIFVLICKQQSNNKKARRILLVKIILFSDEFTETDISAK